MRKILSIILAVCVILSCAIVPIAAESVPMGIVQTSDAIKLIVDLKAVDCLAYGQEPVIQNGRTLVPLRAAFEALGATVEWDNEKRAAVSQKDDVTIVLEIGSDIMKINEQDKKLDVPAEIMNGRTMVPVRAVAEAFGCNVEWDNNARAVIITTIPDTPEKVTEKYIEAFLNLNFEELSKYVENPDEVCELDFEISKFYDEGGELLKKIYREIAKLVDYEITGCEIKGDEAIVTVTFSMPVVDNDLSDEEEEEIINKVLQSYGYTLEEVYADSDKFNAVYETAALEEINYILERMAETAPEEEKIIDTDTVTLVKKNNKWIIVD